MNVRCKASANAERLILRIARKIGDRTMSDGTVCDGTILRNASQHTRTRATHWRWRWHAKCTSIIVRRRSDAGSDVDAWNLIDGAVTRVDVMDSSAAWGGVMDDIGGRSVTSCNAGDRKLSRRKTGRMVLQ